MPANAVQQATRNYIKAERALLTKCKVGAGVQRCASAPALRTVHRKLLLKVHPDKGGNAEDFKLACDAVSAFTAACSAAGEGPGRRAGPEVLRRPAAGSAGSASAAASPSAAPAVYNRSMKNSRLCVKRAVVQL